jgi:hypothetical protein
MRVFLTSVIAATASALIAASILRPLSQPADQAFSSSTSVRLPSHGNTHNLVGSDWYAAKEHGWNEEIPTSNSPSSLARK